MKRTFARSIIFLAFLAWFVWNSSWHEPSQLVIQGRVTSPVDVRVSWDSGSGFNGVESADLVFGTPVKAGLDGSVLSIRRIGERHPASRSTGVWIKALKLSENAQEQPLQAFAGQRGVEMTPEGYLHLQKDGAELQVPAGRDYTAICFIANEYSGFAEIGINGDRRPYDLYADPSREKWIEIKSRTHAAGPFTARMDLPRYDIRRLQIASTEPLQTFRIESIVVSSANGEVTLPLTGSGLLSSLSISDIPSITRRYFQPLHLAQQILFAILSACMTLAVFRFVRSRGGLPRVLFEGKRPVFWLMLLGGLISFGAWLLVYWPGHFTTDSVHIWWAAKQPGYFMHDHPVMNVIFYRYLQQFWDHFAVVGVAQIFFTALLGSYIFYWLHKKGVSLLLIVPFYLLFVTSIPVGLYTISLWKDIPFALLLVFWAFRFVKFVVDKKEGETQRSRGEIITLSLLLIALGLFRYNGIVYFLIVPAGLALLGIFPPKKVLAGSLCGLIAAALLISMTVALDRNRFVMSQSRFFIERMMQSGVGETALRAIRQYPTLLDVNIIKKKKIWYDTWYRDSGVTQWHYDFAREKGFLDWIRYMPCEPKSDRLYEFLHSLNLKSVEEPWVYFTWNPCYLLFLYPLCLLYRLLPLTAAYGFIVLSQVFILLWVLGPYNYNWRYYYFLLFSLYFLIPVIALDIRLRLHPLQIREGNDQKGRWLACRRSA